MSFSIHVIKTTKSFALLNGKVKRMTDEVKLKIIAKCINNITTQLIEQTAMRFVYSIIKSFHKS